MCSEIVDDSRLVAVTHYESVDVSDRHKLDISSSRIIEECLLLVKVVSDFQSCQLFRYCFVEASVADVIVRRVQKQTTKTLEKEQPLLLGFDRRNNLTMLEGSMNRLFLQYLALQLNLLIRQH